MNERKNTFARKAATQLVLETWRKYAVLENYA
jgi:hypothetical protein